jgi:formamidopyrimidine-DNA glycosylase
MVQPGSASRRAANMPELPEVETVVRSLRPGLLGRRITEVELPSYGRNGAGRNVLKRLLVGSAASFRQRLRGARVESIDRHGKNILMIVRPEGNGHAPLCLLVHLGMTGRLLFEPMPEPVRPHTHVIFSLDAPDRWLHFSDPRRFGKLCLTSTVPPQLRALGPEPLEISTEEFYERARPRRAMLKALLLDQRFLRGLGNIYADESLFRAGVHPATLGSQLDRSRAVRLLKAIRETLSAAIELGGSSISNYLDAEGRAGRFQQVHQVYGREGEPCFRCGAGIRRMIIASRSTHFCPHCQLRSRSRRRNAP